MISGIPRIQDTGKTLLMVMCAIDLVANEGFRQSDVTTSVEIKCLPDARVVSIGEMREFCRYMVERNLRRQLVVIDEINSIFPARLWSDKEQTENLLGLWQDFKMGNQIFYTTHIGVSVDKIIREANMGGRLMFPQYYKDKDMLDVIISDFRYLVRQRRQFFNVSRYFKEYDRWQPVR